MNNAIWAWKMWYMRWKDAISKNDVRYVNFRRTRMIDLVYSAALERRLEAAQRTIEAQAQRINELEEDVEGLGRELFESGEMWFNAGDIVSDEVLS